MTQINLDGTEWSSLDPRILFMFEQVGLTKSLDDVLASTGYTRENAFLELLPGDDVPCIEGLVNSVFTALLDKDFDLGTWTAEQTSVKSSYLIHFTRLYMRLMRDFGDDLYMIEAEREEAEQDMDIEDLDLDTHGVEESPERSLAEMGAVLEPYGWDVGTTADGITHIFKHDDPRNSASGLAADILIQVLFQQVE